MQAESLLESGQLDGAKEVLAQALGIAPTSGKTHRLIGQLYSAMQDEESARVHYEAGKFTAAIEPIPITDTRLGSVWGDHLTRIVLTAKDPQQQDTWTLRITR